MDNFFSLLKIIEKLVVSFEESALPKSKDSKPSGRLVVFDHLHIVPIKMANETGGEGDASNNCSNWFFETGVIVTVRN